MTSNEGHDIVDDRISGDARAIQHLKHAIAGGKHWYLALLEAIGMWNSSEEYYKRRKYRYLIDGEAFDWLMLAERLCDEIGDLIPENERINLLFFDRPPLEITKEKFKEMIGPAKYRAYLNFLYGVLVEEALILAVINEVRKEKLAFGSTNHEDDLDRAYNRIYGDDQQGLIDSFRKDKQYSKRKFISLDEIKEFTYWLFKYRVEHCDKSRVASDTKKALLYMQANMAPRKISH
jgi:hypothetical protein